MGFCERGGSGGSGRSTICNISFLYAHALSIVRSRVIECETATCAKTSRDHVLDLEKGSELIEQLKRKKG